MPTRKLFGTLRGAAVMVTAASAIPLALPQTAGEPLRTSVTVVGAVSAETPAGVEAIHRPELAVIPGINLDDRLRTVPGFSLFRRSSSLVAHPTTQGVSLRGVGPSGASRTLVRWDGVPLNDPFGGWVQWTRILPETLDRVEVVPSASTSVFGDRALGGAITLLSRPVDRTRFVGGYEFGGANTHQATGGLAWLGRRFASSIHARGFTTNGYYTVPEEIRGPADTEADVRFAAGAAHVDFLGAANRLFIKFDALAEGRQNGTPARVNSTSLGTVSGHLVRETAANGISLVGYHTRGEFRSVFSALSADRDVETPTTVQSVPSEGYGGAGSWRHSRGVWNAIAGGDFQYVEGYSRDTVLAIPRQRVEGGTLLQHGYYGQLDIGLRRTRLFTGIRYNLADGGRRFISPSAGVTSRLGAARLRASAYRAFRAPTLNELYRQFRVGNVVTLPNDRLEPESMWGVEGGADFIGESARLSLTAFHASLDRVISNVTVATAPSLITRRRENAAAATAPGFEAAARHRWRRLLSQASYLYVDSRFAAGPAVPQVPRHQGSAQITWAGESTLFSAGLRAYASQFEDDLNLFRLPGFAVFHVTLERRVTRSLSATVAIENLANRVFLVGLTPEPAIGNPRLWRAGLRWSSLP